MMRTTTPIVIDGRSQKTFVLSTTGAMSAPVEQGVYDIWSDVDCWIKVADSLDRSTGNKAVTPNRAQDVTTATGYKLYANNVISVEIDENRQLGAVAGGAGNIFFHRTA